jgi:hypothetical protein
MSDNVTIQLLHPIKRETSQFSTFLDAVGSFKKKSPAILLGIDPETLRLAAQSINHYATPGPRHLWERQENTHSMSWKICVVQWYL